MLASSRNGKVRSEGTTLTARGKKYRLVRSRLRDWLLNQIFHLDLLSGGYSEYAAGLYRMRRQVFLAQTLRMLDARRAASDIGINALREAEGLEEWVSILILLPLLRNDAALEGDKVRFEQYDVKLRRAVELFAATQRAKTAVEQTQSIFAGSASDNADSRAELLSALAIVLEVSRAHRTFEITSLEHRLRSTLAQVDRDYKEALRICDEADRLLDEYPIFRNRARAGEYALKRLVCAIQLRDVEACGLAIQRCEHVLHEGENNWFSFKEYQFVYLMHQLKFQEAYALVMTVVRSRRFSEQSELVHERWDLFRLYSEVLTNRPVPGESLNELLKLVPEFKKDKAGFNFAVLLLHLLVLIERKDEAGVFDRIESLKVYRRRYLKEEQNDQADLLVKLLLLLAANDLDLERVNEQQQKQNLAFENTQVQDVLKGLQIVPFDWFWAHVLNKIRHTFPSRG